MGTDTPLACLSTHPKLAYDYFKQLFAQVTNPPIDPIREAIVMSLTCPIGPEGNILQPAELDCRRIFLEHPVLTPASFRMLCTLPHKGWKPKFIDTTYNVKRGA